ncbi:MAG: nitroreductase family protein [Acidobacteriota bacterium]|nr:nitroreductase family protein [Acidobacteriota bacterium]MDE3190614.1 nitroreductase family protein [Acidobacteriota bacterium]
MDLRDILRRRRMVRHYTGEAVPRETLERIVATVRRAPSAGFSQGQRLLVVDDPGLLTDLAALAGGPDDPDLEPWFPSAPAHVLVLTREGDYHDRYQSEDKLREGEEVEWPVPFWYVDAGATLMLVLLTAVDEGLSAGVYGVPVEQDAAFRALLGIPDDLRIVAGVTIGRGAPDPGWSGKTSRATQRRRSLDELVRWNTW